MSSSATYVYMHAKRVGTETDRHRQRDIDTQRDRQTDRTKTLIIVDRCTLGTKRM